MDILYLVDRLENLIAGSRKMPLVNQIIVKEGDILTIVDQMRTTIPDEIKQARRIIQEKERILAQAQAEASTLLARAREETERAMNREGLLRAAEQRSQELVHSAEQQAQRKIQEADAHGEQLKNEADNYVAETLRNIRDHLATIEMDISRDIISIEKGLESLGLPEAAVGSNAKNADEDNEQNGYFDDAGDQDEPEDFEEYEAAPSPINTKTRLASLANDTIGGPIYPADSAPR
jgi:vacuolar-type H+-ATPase subunit H